MDKLSLIFICILSFILRFDAIVSFVKSGVDDLEPYSVYLSNELMTQSGLRSKSVFFLSDNISHPVDADNHVNDSLHKTSTRNIVQRIGDTDISNIKEYPSVYFFKSGMQIDADGAPKAYHKDPDLGLDHLKNAGKKGNWWGIVTVNGRSGGIPSIQGSDDPAPGYYVAGTSLQDSTKEDADPDRYVDSAEIPYIALPSGMKFPVKTGDFGFVINTENNMTSGCVFADVGPRGKIGEGSIALAEAVGISSDPKGDGTESKFIYVLFSNSSMGWPLTVDFINTHSKELFEQWGGMQRLKEVMP
jgi:hypothetical protein